MAKLIGLLGAVVAIGVGVFFWRKQSTSGDAMWDEAKDSTSQWGTPAMDEAQKAADKMAGASNAAGTVTSDLVGEDKWRSSQFPIGAN